MFVSPIYPFSLYGGPIIELKRQTLEYPSLSLDLSSSDSFIHKLEKMIHLKQGIKTEKFHPIIFLPFSKNLLNYPRISEKVMRVW